MPLLYRNPNVYYGSGRRVHRRQRRRAKGGSWLGDAVSNIGSFFKKHKLISRGANALSGILPGAWGTAAGLVGKTANSFGYGLKRRRVIRKRRVIRRRVVKRRRMVKRVGGRRRVYRKRVGGRIKRRVYRRHGGSLRSIASKIHNFAKNNRLISKGLAHFGHPKLSAAASNFGYGRKRRRTKRRGGSLRSMASKFHGFVKKNQLISKGLSHFGHPKLASAASNFGYGMKRRLGGSMMNGRDYNYLRMSQIAAPRF